ncbi:MAG TPA: hypothetical protein VJC05_02110 [Candidatus Andersenbacteria bacterium]|nr:hypothetical protein [Candidatus Andersenbacteria bacterium]
MLKIFLVLFLFGLLLPLPAYQQAPFVDCSSRGCTLENLLEVPVRVYNFLLYFSGLVALAVIVVAGVRMMLFHLAEAPESELQNAKLTLTRGIFGLLIIAGAYVIVALILNLLGLQAESGLGSKLRDFGIQWQ